ncbi:hypothetical protein CEXT_99591 [Caerostris extrusa]|uniref:Secreted protein n=1 Tax=Caerostris extrusa TaxID=172846 RepID=A0AAV4RAH9_CAEEX|nr:hypothetical protein CEXT_99591 [Caerostris extrusa]
MGKSGHGVATWNNRPTLWVMTMARLHVANTCCCRLSSDDLVNFTVASSRVGEFSSTGTVGGDRLPEIRFGGPI